MGHSKFTYRNTFSLPTPFAWITASVATVISLSFALFILVCGEGVSQLLLFEQFSADLLLESAPEDIRTQYDSLLKVKPSLPVRLISSITSDRSEVAKQREKQVTELIFEILWSINGNDIKEANARFNTLSENYIYDVLFKLGGDFRARKVLDSLSEHLQTAISIQKQERLNTERLKDLDVSLENTHDQFRLVAEDFSSFLKLRPAIERDPSEPLSVYSDGALKGLPKVIGIPDALSDLNQFAEHLEIAGGSVSVRGVDAHTKFLKALSRYRSQTSALVGKQQEFFDERTKIFTEGESAAEALTNAKHMARRLSVKMLISQFRPDFSQTSAKAYMTLIRINDSIGLFPNLPRLELL